MNMKRRIALGKSYYAIFKTGSVIYSFFLLQFVICYNGAMRGKGN
jgi:hypothetical protein